MSYPSKQDFLFIIKELTKQIIIEYENRTFHNFFKTLDIIANTLWNISFKNNIKQTHTIILYRFIIQYLRDSLTSPITERIIIHRLTLALDFILSHTIQQIYKYIPQKYIIFGNIEIEATLD